MVALLHNRISKVCVLVAGTLILPALACAQENSPIAAPQTQIDSLQTTVVPVTFPGDHPKLGGRLVEATEFEGALVDDAAKALT